MMRNTPDEETTDWRAVCEKTARAVRRAGRVKTLSDPYIRSPPGRAAKRRNYEQIRSIRLLFEVALTGHRASSRHDGPLQILFVAPPRPNYKLTTYSIDAGDVFLSSG